MTLPFVVADLVFIAAGFVCAFCDCNCDCKTGSDCPFVKLLSRQLGSLFSAGFSTLTLVTLLTGSFGLTMYLISNRLFLLKESETEAKVEWKIASPARFT